MVPRKEWGQTLAEVHKAVGASPGIHVSKMAANAVGIRPRLAAGAASGNLEDPAGMIARLEAEKTEMASLDGALVGVLDGVRASLKQLADARVARLKDLPMKSDAVFAAAEKELSKAYFSTNSIDALGAKVAVDKLKPFVDFNHDYAEAMKLGDQLTRDLNGLGQTVKTRNTPSTQTERNKSQAARDKLQIDSTSLFKEASTTR